MANKELYRCVDKNYEEHIAAESFRVERYYVKSETPCFYITTQGQKIKKVGKNLFAFDTIEKAIKNYGYRKAYQIAMLKTRLAKAEGDFNTTANQLKEKYNFELKNRYQ